MQFLRKFRDGLLEKLIRRNTFKFMALDRARLVSYTQVDGEGCSLRRRRNLVFPVFLLALLAQIFAPGVGVLPCTPMASVRRKGVR